MRHQLARLFYPYGSTRRILRGPSRGMRLVVEPGIGLSYILAVDAATPRFFTDVVERGATIFDVGANKGQMALLFAALVGETGLVVALEPAAPEFSSLKRNIQLNRLRNVEALPVAAAERDGEAVFLYTPSAPTQGKLSNVEPSYSLPQAKPSSVLTRSLDGLVLQHGVPDVVKIDVEGAAASVLRGARHLIGHHGPRFYLELHGPEEQAGVRDELVARGYVAETLDGDVVNDPTAGWFSPLWCYKPGQRDQTC